jgi:hypothetical protein
MFRNYLIPLNSNLLSDLSSLSTFHSNDARFQILHMLRACLSKKCVRQRVGKMEISRNRHFDLDISKIFCFSLFYNPGCLFIPSKFHGKIMIFTNFPHQFTFCDRHLWALVKFGKGVSLCPVQVENSLKERSSIFKDLGFGWHQAS